MSCAELLQTQAYVDGELDGDAAKAAEAHIAGCAHCQAFCADAADLSDRMRKAGALSAPAEFRTRVRAALDAAGEPVEDGPVRILPPREPPGPPRPRGRVSSPAMGFWTGAFSGAGGLAVAAMLALMLLPRTPDTLVAEATQAHTDALMAGRTIAVVSSDHHTVKPWFAGRIALSPPVTDFAAQGFSLTGGRLDKLGGQPAAVVAYQHGKHEIDLFVWADHGQTLPPPSVRLGYHSLYWRSGDLDFAAVSDTQPADLAAFVALAKAEPE